jgi:nitrite reductase/ring-hydroxylating ferredoxin subunit
MNKLQLKINVDIVTLVRVAKTFDAPEGKMKHVEIDGIEILIADVEGKLYAVGDNVLT